MKNLAFLSLFGRKFKLHLTLRQ